MENLGERIELVLESWAGIANRKVEDIRLLHQVHLDLFNETVTQGCGNCNQKAFLRIRKYAHNLNTNPLNSNLMKNLKDRKYILNDGIVLQHNFGEETFTNENLTDDRAERLLASNPGYAQYFSKLPDGALEAADKKAVKDFEATQPKRLEKLKEMEKDSGTKVETDYPVQSRRVDSEAARVETEKVLIDETEQLPTTAEPENSKADLKEAAKANKEAAKEVRKSEKE